MHDLSTGAQQVLDALTEIGQGTVAEIREKTSKSARVTDKAIRELADAALITETDPGDGNPASWSLAPAAEPTDPATATDAEADAGTDAALDEAANLVAGDPADADNPGQLDQPTGPTTDLGDETAAEQIPADAADKEGNDDGSGTPTDDTATETEQVPARPKPPADRRVLAVRGVLGDYPDGATIDEIAEATGYKYGAVALLLQAMEQADAARRIPEDTEAGTEERWQAGPGKAIDVDPNPAPPRCPTCHQVIRSSTPKTATATVRSGGGSATVNSDGNEPLGRNVLRAWTAEFINAHPGHDLTPDAIANALAAQHRRTVSTGAVLNNCRALAMTSQIRVVRHEDPFTVTANKPAADSTTDSDQEPLTVTANKPAADSTTDSDGEQQ